MNCIEQVGQGLSVTETAAERMALYYVPMQQERPTVDVVAFLVTKPAHLVSDTYRERLHIINKDKVVCFWNLIAIVRSVD